MVAVVVVAPAVVVALMVAIVPVGLVHALHQAVNDYEAFDGRD